MGIQVCMGATLQCSFGAGTSVLSVPPDKKVLTQTPAATIMDYQPFANIPPFGMCSASSNPLVAAATQAAQGVLTPIPCIPVITAPWTPGAPTVLIGEMPALNETSKLTCQWGGVIQILVPGQVTVQVP